ncbi:MAG: hypothetical protein JG777_2797 [Clostridia bacterium]|nr:hypothetical protein [Clostridia bacterium]
MKKKLRLTFLSFVLMISFAGIASAASFPDVDAVKWGWAKSVIEEMSSKGYITGYPDGTFGPSKPVTKLQSLILAARILGVNDETNADYVKLAEEAYTDELQYYNVSNKKEIAYLLYKNVITEDELDTYISSTNANTPLKRYEAAILFTKLMGKEKEVKNKLLTVLPYQDISLIPSHAKPYVEYVNNENIMKGMSETEFGPMVDVSRAQIAVMLHRVLQKNEMIDESVEGVITSLTRSGIEKKISIKISENNVLTTKEYAIDNEVVVTYNNTTSTLYAINTQDYARLDIKGGKVRKIEAESKTKEIEGVVQDIVLEPVLKLQIKSDNNELQEYEVLSNVTVTKNSSSSDLRNVRVGDTVELTLEYNKVKKIIATSVRSSTTGNIEEIVISKTPSIKVKTNNTITVYNLTRDVTITVDGKTAQIYDLRLGYPVQLTVDGSTVIKVEAKTITQAQTITGTVELVNTSYKLINISMIDAATGETTLQQIFINSSTKIISHKDSKTIYLNDIKVGDTITAVGTINTGVFEASTIVVTTN